MIEQTVSTSRMAYYVLGALDRTGPRKQRREVMKKIFCCFLGEKLRSHAFRKTIYVRVDVYGCVNWRDDICAGGCVRVCELFRT